MPVLAAEDSRKLGRERMGSMRAVVLQRMHSMARRHHRPRHTRAFVRMAARLRHQRMRAHTGMWIKLPAVRMLHCLHSPQLRYLVAVARSKHQLFQVTNQCQWGRVH